MSEITKEKIGFLIELRKILTPLFLATLFGTVTLLVKDETSDREKLIIYGGLSIIIGLFICILVTFILHRKLMEANKN